MKIQSKIFKSNKTDLKYNVEISLHGYEIYPDQNIYKVSIIYEEEYENDLMFRDFEDADKCYRFVKDIFCHKPFTLIGENG